MGWARRRYGNPDDNQQGIFDTIRPLPASVVNTTAIGDGFPDGVVGFQGLTVLVEVKRPGKKNKLRPTQERFRREWRGGPVLTVDDGADAISQLIKLDTLTPPVRGLVLSTKFGTAERIVKELMAVAGGHVVDEDDLPALLGKLLANR